MPATYLMHYARANACRARACVLLVCTCMTVGVVCSINLVKAAALSFLQSCAHDLRKRSAPAFEVGRTRATPTSPSRARGVKKIEAGWTRLL